MKTDKIDLNFERANRPSLRRKFSIDMRLNNPQEDLEFDSYKLTEMVSSLYSYVNGMYAELNYTRDDKKAHFEKYQLEQYIHDLTVYIYYWPHAFTSTGLINTLRLLNKLSEIVNESDAFDLDIKKRVLAKIQLAKNQISNAQRDFEYRWILEDEKLEA